MRNDSLPSQSLTPGFVPWLHSRKPTLLIGLSTGSNPDSPRSRLGCVGFVGICEHSSSITHNVPEDSEEGRLRFLGFVKGVSERYLFDCCALDPSVVALSSCNEGVILFDILTSEVKAAHIDPRPRCQEPHHSSCSTSCRFSQTNGLLVAGFGPDGLGLWRFDDSLESFDSPTLVHHHIEIHSNNCEILEKLCPNWVVSVGDKYGGVSSGLSILDLEKTAVIARKPHLQIGDGSPTLGLMGTNGRFVAVVGSQNAAPIEFVDFRCSDGEISSRNSGAPGRDLWPTHSFLWNPDREHYLYIGARMGFGVVDVRWKRESISLRSLSEERTWSGLCHDNSVFVETDGKKSTGGRLIASLAHSSCGSSWPDLRSMCFLWKIGSDGLVSKCLGQIEIPGSGDAMCFVPKLSSWEENTGRGSLKIAQDEESERTVWLMSGLMRGWEVWIVFGTVVRQRLGALQWLL